MDGWWVGGRVLKPLKLTTCAETTVTCQHIYVGGCNGREMCKRVARKNAIKINPVIGRQADRRASEGTM